MNRWTTFMLILWRSWRWVTRCSMSEPAPPISAPSRVWSPGMTRRRVRRLIQGKTAKFGRILTCDVRSAPLWWVHSTRIRHVKVQSVSTPKHSGRDKCGRGVLGPIYLRDIWGGRVTGRVLESVLRRKTNSYWRLVPGGGTVSLRRLQRR